MNRESIEGNLIAAIQGLSKAFRLEDGELAYLALTSKPELPVRDRLAFALHQTLRGPYLVAREWARVDLAILSMEDGKVHPKGLLQIKTWSLFTFISKAESQFAKIREDADKCHERWKHAATYCLLLATLPSQILGGQYNGVIKYLRGWERAVATWVNRCSTTKR